MPNVFFTSDLHLDHDAIRRHCNRPFASVEEMNETMVSRWNEVVTPKDDVYVIGDFAWKRHDHWIQALHGHKHLVIGNHDRMSAAALASFTEVVGTPKCPGIKVLAIDTKVVALCHFSLRSWPASHYGAWHFYGHSHGRHKEFPDSISCAVDVDVWDYRPIPWEILRAKMEAREPVWRAHWEQNRRSKEDIAAHLAQLAEENRTWRTAFAPIGGHIVP
jgi:calcineurin-like phosphoesterase family protein